MTLTELDNLKQKYNIPIIYLDFYNSSYNVIQSKQLDSCRYIICHFTENGIERTLKENEIPRIRLLKPDNTYVYNECEVVLEDKSVLIHLTEQMLASTGKARADIQISSPEGIYSTKVFYLNIEKTAYPNDAIESSNEFDALNDLVQRENERYQVVLNLEKEITKNEQVRQDNESIRNQNESTRATSENERISNENSRTSNENTRISSENTRIANENSRKQEESKRQSAENARANEENTRKTNESNRSSAENIRKSNENTRISNEEQRQSNETSRQTNEGNRNKAEYSRENAESVRQDNENDRISDEDARQDNESIRESNEATRQSQEIKRQADTSTAISNANNAAKKANDKASDLQSKLDSHHFVLTEDKDVANGVPSLDDNIKIPRSELYEATTTAKGIVQLTDSISSTSTSTAATPNSVKTVNDSLASEKNRAVSAEKTLTENLNAEISRATTAETTHFTNYANPHKTTKSQVGLGNVDNTSDANKPVSAAQKKAINTAYENSNKYTDQKIADLIGGAPETLDTLKEVADAIAENKNVESALNEAIGTKANQSELDTHTGNTTIHITQSERINWNAAKTHADSAHARTDATKVEKSTTNGNIKINGTETNVYTHPSGTNPHGTTKSDVGLGNVGNFKAVSTVASQGLTDAEKANARDNIGAQIAGSYSSSSHNHDTVYSKLGHTHDDRYYTESEMNAKLGIKVDSSADGVSKAINQLSTGTSTPSDADYYISQYAGGGTTTTTYHRRPISALWNYIKGKADKVYSALGHKHTKAEITDFPSSMPANDVQAWAKAKTKPSYSKSEVGLGNVDNTADANKSVKYATSAGSATKSTGVVDYGSTAKTIQIGYGGDGISGDNIKYIAGYTSGNGSDVTAKIKDISKDNLKSWLGLGSLAYSSATIPTSLPANGGTATYANYVYATSHQGSWYQNSQWDGTYFQTNYKNGNNVLPMKVNNAGYADSAGSANSVAWANVSGKPSTFTPSSHSHSYNDLTNKPTLGSAASKTVRTLSASGASGWKGLSTDQNYVPDMAFMALWNGAFSGSSSNLAYCNKGAFGTAATANKGDFAASSHTHSQYYDTKTSRTANTVLAAPNGSNGTASFRKLVAADIPSLPYLSAGENLLDSGTLAHPRVTSSFSMAPGDAPLIISTLVGACSNVSGDYRARMHDSVLISFFATAYGELLHRGDCTINTMNKWSELKFPSTGYSSQINASATITSENKVVSATGGILKLKIVPKTDIMLVVEYSLGLTSIIS